jgi:hypothetical protein
MEYFTKAAQVSNEAFDKLVDFLGLTDVEYAEDQFSPFDVSFTYRGKKCVCEIKKVHPKYGQGRIEVEGYDLEKQKVDKILAEDVDKKLWVFVYPDKAVWIDLDKLDKEWKFQNWIKNSSGNAEKILKKVYTCPYSEAIKIIF